MSRALNLLLFCVFSASSWSLSANDSKQNIDIFFYHDKPPLVIDKQLATGQYFDVVSCLNNQSSEYSFNAAYVPKPRIEQMIKTSGLEALVLGVHPNWFKDKHKEKYLWSNVILTDQDEFVSLTTSPFHYNDDSSFNGKVVGGVRGFFYKGINTAVKQKTLTRVDTINEKALLYMLLTKRIDFAIVSRSALIHYNKDKEFTNKFHLSTVPHESFTRHIMLTLQQTKLLNHVNTLIDKACAF